MSPQNESRDWHLDKKVSICIIIALIGNFCSGIWYGAKLDSNVQETRTQVAELRLWKDHQDDERSKIDAHLAVVDERLSEQASILRRIDDHVEVMSRRR